MRRKCDEKKKCIDSMMTIRHETNRKTGAIVRNIHGFGPEIPFVKLATSRHEGKAANFVPINDVCSRLDE